MWRFKVPILLGVLLVSFAAFSFWYIMSHGGASAIRGANISDNSDSFVRESGAQLPQSNTSDSTDRPPTNRTDKNPKPDKELSRHAAFYAVPVRACTR